MIKSIFDYRIYLTIGVGCLLSFVLVSGLPWYYAVGFMFVWVITLIAINNPLHFLFALFLIRPALDSVLSGMRFGDTGGFGFGGAVSLFLIVLTGFYMLTSPNSLRGFSQPIVKMYLVFIAISACSYFFPQDKVTISKTLINYVAILSITLLTFLLSKTEKETRVIIRSIVLSPMLCLSLGIFTNKRSVDGRFAATFAHPNILAFYLLIIIGCLLLNIESYKREKKFSTIKKFYFLILVTALAFTQTRSGWGAFVVMLGIYSLFFNRKFILPGIIMLLVLLCVPFVKEHIANIFHSHGKLIQVNEQSSLGWRFEKWSYLWTPITKKPLTGYGIGAATEYGKDKLGAHNDYLRFLIESGIFGLISYFLPFWYMLYRAIKDRKGLNEQSITYRLAQFFIIFIPAFLVMSITENLGNYVIIQWYIWALFGIYFGLISARSEHISNHAKR